MKKLALIVTLLSAFAVAAHAAEQEKAAPSVTAEGEVKPADAKAPSSDKDEVPGDVKKH